MNKTFLPLLKENNIRIFAYGHTHRRKFENELGIYVVNPGAISFARDKYDYSYAIMNITTDKVEVEFHTLDE